MLYAAGVPDQETMANAPHVGIATVWWEGNPCNTHRKHARPWQYGNQPEDERP